jgi:sentrin-specific protease 1
MGILAKHLASQKRKKKIPAKSHPQGPFKRHDILSTDLILPVSPSPVRTVSPTLLDDRLIPVNSNLWEALKLEVETHLEGRLESTVDQLATALKSSVHITTWAKDEKNIEKLTGKMQNISISHASSADVRQGLTNLEQAPKSQQAKVATVDQAMKVLETIFIVKDDRNTDLQKRSKREGSFMDFQEYLAIVLKNVSSISIKGLERIKHSRLRGIARASARGREGAEQSALDKIDAKHKEDTEREYEESKIRAMPKSIQDEVREQRANERRNAEARDSAASLLCPLTTEEQHSVDDAIYGIGRPDDVLFRVGTDTVVRESMHRLQPGQWLNDEVIHYFYVMLANRDKDLCRKDPSRKPSHFFKSFFMTKLLNEGHSDARMDGRYEYRQVKRWSKNVPGKDLFGLDKVFFPINQGNSHWICAVAFMKEKRIQMYDSLGGPGRPYLEAIFQYLQDDHKDKKKCQMPDQDEWVLVTTQGDTPNQRNGTCCDDPTMFTIIQTFNTLSFCFLPFHDRVRLRCLHLHVCGFFV